MEQNITPPVKKPRSSGQYSLGLVFAIVGAVIFYFWGWPPLKYAYESKSWPSATGTIIKSEVDSWMKDGKSQYEARINYSYEINGKKYNSTKISTSGSYSGSNMTKAKEFVAAYPNGKTVDVFYDPEVPDSAALIPGPRLSDFALAGVPLIFLVIGLLVLFKAIKPQRSYSNTRNKGGRIDIRNFLKR